MGTQGSRATILLCLLTFPKRYMELPEWWYLTLFHRDPERVKKYVRICWLVFIFQVCFCCCCCFLVFWFFKTGFPCSFGACPGTSSCRPGQTQTHRDLPGSASQVLGLKVWANCNFLLWYTYKHFSEDNYRGTKIKCLFFTSAS